MIYLQMDSNFKYKLKCKYIFSLMTMYISNISYQVWSYQNVDIMQFSYNKVNFLYNIHNRRPIVRLW